MTVRMLEDILGPGFIWRLGEVHEVADKQGKQWCKNGAAEPIAIKRVERAEKR